MLDTKVVQVTGRGTSVNFVIDDSAPMEKVAQGLYEHLKDHRSLYSRGSITVNVGRRILDREELTRIKEILEKESGVTVARFWCAPEILEQALSESIGFGVAVSAADAPRRDDTDRPRTQEVRKPIEWREMDPSGLEQWAAYILEETPPRKRRTPAPTDPEPADQTATAEEASPETEQETGPEGAAARQEVQDAPKAGTEEASTPASPLPPEPEPDHEPVSLVEAPTGPSEVAPEELPEHALDQIPATAPPERELAARPQPRPTLPGVRPFPPQPEMVGLDRGNEALLIKTTCRSGEVIRYPGDVVVMADVNPGAEIIADGDILVFGNLRGLAHAGAGGDIQATIIALNLDTHRLQIGPYTGVAPKSNKRSKSNTSNPRIALVRRRSIYVAPYIGRFAGYSGGTLYDG